MVSNDVLQHVDESDVGESLAELRRVLEAGGTLQLRTNGSRRLRRERHDWRAYDRATLREQLESAGFRCERVSYVNTLLSLYGAIRGRVPHAPSEDRDGLPRSTPSDLVSTVGARLLRAEARWLAGNRADRCPTGTRSSRWRLGVRRRSGVALVAAGVLVALAIAIALLLQRDGSSAARSAGAATDGTATTPAPPFVLVPTRRCLRAAGFTVYGGPV